MVERADLYAVLGVAPTATPEQIRRAYRAMLRRHHPDSRGADAGLGAARGDGRGAVPADVPGDARDEAFQRAVAAYAVLGDPQARADYDRTRRGRAAPGGQPVAVRRTEPARRGGGDAQPAIRVGPVRWQRP